jgi:hypothetical protein
MTTSKNSAITTSTLASTVCLRTRLLRPLTLIVLIVMSALGALAQANAHRVDLDKDKRGVPPAGYIPEEIKQDIKDGKIKLEDFENPNPALDFDLYGDKKMTAWSIPIAIGGGFATTDEKGNLVFNVGIPDPMGLKNPKYLGWGDDHYSPRFRKNGGKPEGDIVGKCVYTVGRNLWYLAFLDANNNKIPDQFLKSWWRSRNGEEKIKDPKDATKEIPNPGFNERTYFVTDLTAAKIEYEQIIRKPNEPNETKLFSFGDAEIEDLGPDPTSAAPSSPVFGTEAIVQQSQDDQLPLEINVLQDVNQGIVVGQPFQIYGEIKNNDYTSHTFYFASLGINGSVSGLPTPFMLGPGQQAPYTMTVVPAQAGWASVSVLVWSDALTDGDGALDTVFFSVQ